MILILCLLCMYVVFSDDNGPFVEYGHMLQKTAPCWMATKQWDIEKKGHKFFEWCHLFVFLAPLRCFPSYKVFFEPCDQRILQRPHCHNRLWQAASFPYKIEKKDYVWKYPFFLEELTEKKPYYLRFQTNNFLLLRSNGIKSLEVSDIS